MEEAKPNGVRLRVNIADVAEESYEDGAHWRGAYKPLTPALDALRGQGRARLGVNLSRMAPHTAACPFHSHALEDEVFYVLSGRGVFRHGDTIEEIHAGDCISCPAGTGIAHQLGNPFDEELVYLGIGMNEPHEVCTYPDSGKVMVRALKTVGYLNAAPYMDGEPPMPKILTLDAQPGGGAASSQ